jgi:N-sulfoglucosamine sulfohydrolase
MRRREFMKSSTLAALAAGSLQRASARSAKPQNVVLFVADDWGTDDAGCYGNPAIKTPGLDSLAAEGVRFTHSFCTTASCSASRSVILSGLHNHKTGQYGHAHAYHHFVSFPDLKTLPARLSEAGYRTLCAGKYHVAPEPVYPFDRFQKRLDPPEMAEACREFLEEESDRPFFLYFCTTEPHRNFNRKGSDPVDPKDVVVPDYLPDTPECREELAQYYGSVQLADKGLARLIGILKEAGHWEDTLFIFISDNGVAFPGAKTNLYEPGARLPCVIHDPASDRTNETCDAMMTWADLAPTILEWTGVSYDPGGFHGRSFLEPLRGGDASGWEEVFLSHTFHEITMYYPMRVVRTRKYKLIWNVAHGLDFPFASDLYESTTWQGILKRGETLYGKRTVEAYLHRPKFELYDLEKDPDEVVNLAEDPKHAADLADLKGKLLDFQERTGDPWRLKWRYE